METYIKFLCCPKCSGNLQKAKGLLRCDQCGADYAAPFDVPVLVSGAKLEVTAPPSDNFVRDVAAALGAAGLDEKLKESFALRLEMPDLRLQAEAEQFGHRLSASGHSISGLSSAPSQTYSTNVLEEIDVRLEPLILPKSFPAAGQVGVNVRVRNAGGCSISSSEHPPLTLSYRWRKKPDWRHFWRATEEAREGVRTHLLIDIKPDGVITQPIFIDVPREPGNYHLEFAVVLETVQWIFDRRNVYDCVVQPADRLPPPRYTQNLEGSALSYLEQRQYGIDLLNKWLASYVNASDPIVVEIGGNYNAAVESVRSAKRINVDVDFHGLMARNIIKRDEIVSVVADGMNVPLKDGSVDAIVLFATFHHFPEPIELLSRLKSKLKPGGLICLMSEPIGHVASHHNYTMYVDELKKGVYEQSFEIWEYEAFFEAARLRIAEAVFDRGAAMIALRI